MVSKKFFNKSLVIVFWELGIGGIQTRLADIVRVSLNRGARVTILLERKSNQEIDLPISDKLKIIYFKNEKYKKLRRPLRRFERFRFLRWIMDQVWKEKPSNVLVFLNRFSFFLVITRIVLRLFSRDFRLVLNEGIFTSKYLEQYESKWWKYLVSWAYPKSDLIIVPTKAVKDDLKKNFKIPISKIKIIKSWVEVTSDINLKKIYDGVYVGRLTPEKGIKTLVVLAKLIKKRKLKYKLSVVGDGILKAYLEREIKKHNLEKILVFLGYKNHEETKKIIKVSRLFLLPSINEGLPMTVLEAGSMGVAAVSKNFKGASETIINDKTGIISKLSDRDYCDRVLEILANKKEIEIMGLSARKVIKENFSKDNLEKFVDEIFK